jgi:CHAT domain-containing protein/Tfp pilus assembly protein PilF
MISYGSVISAALIAVLLAGATIHGAPRQSAVPDWQARVQRAAGLFQERRGEEALRLMEQTLREVEAAVGPAHDTTAEVSNALALFYYRLGRAADAPPLWQRAIAIWEKAGAGFEAKVALGLENLAEMYRATGRAAEAEPLQRRALIIKEKILGPEHREVAETIARLAVIYIDLGRYPEGERLMERALDIDVKILGPTHPDVGILVGNLAVLDRLQGRYAQSETRSLRAKAILETVPGPAHPELVKQIRNLGDLALVRGRYAEAVSLHEQAIATLAQALGPEHPDVALPLNSLAGALVLQGKYAAAESNYRRALLILENSRGPAHPEVAQVLGNLGLLFTRTGRYVEAGVVLERALQLKEQAQGPAHPDFALSLANLARLRALQDRYTDAEMQYRRAIAIQEMAFGREHAVVAVTLNNLADLLQHHGRPRDAELLFERALAIHEKSYGGEHKELAATLNNLYLARAAQGRGREAEPLLRRSLMMSERILGPEHPDVAQGTSILAFQMAADGRLEEAVQLQTKALAISEKALGPRHPQMGLALNNLSHFLADQGRYPEAAAMLRKALEVSEQALGADHPQLALLSLNLGASNYALGRPVEAVTFADRGMQIIRAQLQRNIAYMSEKERLAFLDSVSDQFPLYLGICFSYRATMPELVGKMYDFVLWNKGFVVGGVAALRARVQASGDAEAIGLLTRLTARRTQLATLLGSPPPDRTEWRAMVDRLETEADAFEKDLARRSAAFAEQSRLAEATWQDVQRALQPGDVAVEFVRFRFRDGTRAAASRYVALVLTPETKAAPILVDLGDAEALETQPFASYAAHVRARGLVQKTTGAAASLGFHAALWKPLEAALAGARRVYVSPDGKLNQVSWGAIADEAGRLLIEHQDVRLVSSTRDLLRPVKASAGSSAVLVGNPDFDVDAAPAVAPTGAGARSRDIRTTAGPLPATDVEVQSLQTSLQARGWSIEVHTGARALESTVKRVRGPRVLHIATHGFFLSDQERPLGSAGLADRPSAAEDPMLRSGLLFAGANRALRGAATPPDREDGVLTAYEAAGLYLQGTELVVLSACETGLGEVRSGEGVFGLRRALEVAGAQSVLMSLWAVPDRETQELMSLFYEKWLAGQGKPEALRAAQLEMRQRVRTRYGQDLPYYWAAFILVGH